MADFPDKDIVSTIRRSLAPAGLEIPPGDPVGRVELERWLEVAVARMIDEDFNGLLHALYRIDVSEQLVKETLARFPDRPSARVIASLIVDRQLEKWRSRQKLRPRDGKYFQDP